MTVTGTAVPGAIRAAAGFQKRGEPAGGGAGKRTSKTVSGATTSYVYDANRALPVVLEDGARKYVWGNGLAYAVDGAGNAEVYYVDGLGSVRAIANASAEVVQTYRTDEFGVPVQAQGSGTQPFQYTGEQRDEESGLVYLRARMYDPAVGRFLTKDQFPSILQKPWSINRYSYAANNAPTFSDPSGQIIPLVVAGATVGAIVSSGTYLLTSALSDRPITFQGVAGAATAGAVAGGIGVVAAPIATAVGLGGGVVGTAVINAAAGLAGYGAQSVVDPSAGFTAEGAVLAGAFGSVGGYLGSRIAPTKGMSNFRQVGLPRTWAGVVPRFLGGRAGPNAITAIYTGGGVAAGVGAVGPVLGATGISVLEPMMSTDPLQGNVRQK